MLKNIIKKLAKRFLTEREIKSLLKETIFIYPDIFSLDDARELITKIFRENPRFRDFILFRKSQLLNSALTENKEYIQGALGELFFLESLEDRFSENNFTQQVEQGIDISGAIENLKNFYKERSEVKK
jgi:hypothetical protein